MEFTSDSGDTETLVLPNTQGSIYTATIQIGSGAVSIEDGTLQAATGDDFQITYVDLDDGSGNSVVNVIEASVGDITTFTSNDVPINIIDSGRISSEIVITEAGTIADVDVQVDIDHTFVGDLRLFLSGPDGRRITLYNRSGGGGDDFDDTVFDDSAPVSISDGNAPYAGRFSPVGDLSQLNDTLVTGTWTLEVRDIITQNVGTLNSWSLFVDLVTDDAVSSDFNNDGAHDCGDIDSLSSEIAAGSNNLAFDLTGDGVVNLDDRDAWLAEAGSINGLSSSYLLGDFNLDGSVDGSDFNIWNENRFTTTSAWCQGDATSDGVVDASDFNEWNQNKFTSSTLVSPALDFQPIDNGTPREAVATELLETVAAPTSAIQFADFQLPSANNDRLRQRVSPIDAVFAEVAKLGEDVKEDDAFGGFIG